MRTLAIIIGLGWIIFWLYWLVSAFGSKKEVQPNIKQFFGIRLAIFPLVVILITGFNRLPQSLKNHYQALNNNNLVLALGFVIFLLGFYIAVWARINLGKNWGMPMTQKQSPELVTSGLYQYIRHPIYTGILFMMLGSFVDVNIYWLVVFIVASVFFVYSALSEERLMMKQFPKAYPPYKAKTKMLIPFLF